MCNLYRMSQSTAEVGRLFSVPTAGQTNAGGSVYPGYPGMIIAEGALQTMVWGFPLFQKSKRTGEPLKPRPVNNARADKLDGFFWRHSFEERGCLIPLTAWAEAEGAKDAKTRTWQAMPDGKPFAVAGIWRESDEWGRAYSMVMTDATGPAAKIHDRMPVVLRPDDHSTWQNGSTDAAKRLCVAFDGELAIDQTDIPWVHAP